MPALLVKINVDDKGNVAIEKLAKTAQRATPKVKNLGDTMRNAFAVIGIYKGINFLITKLNSATSEALKYERAMKKIKAIGNETSGTMIGLGKDIDDLALKTGIAYSRIAEAQLAISKAGIRGAEGTEVLRHSLDLATVAGEETGAVSEGLINILNAFGMGTERAGYAANVMSVALNETILNLEEYLEAMKYSAPVASQLNVSFEKLSAIIGILAQTGQRGSLAGTGLRNVLLNMLKVTPAVAESFKNMKVESMGVVELLKLLNENGLPVADLLKQFNKRGILAAIALGKNADSVEDLHNRLTDLSRPLSQVADEMREDLLTQLERLNNHFVMIINTINKEMGANGKTFLDNFMLKLADFNNLLKSNPQLLREWAKAIESLGRVLLEVIPVMGWMVKHSRELILVWAGTTVATKITGVVLAISKLKKLSIGFTLNPIVLAVGSLATVVATLGVKLHDTNKRLQAFKKSADKFGYGKATVTPLENIIKSKATSLAQMYAQFLTTASEAEIKAVELKNYDAIQKFSQHTIKKILDIYKLESSLEKDAQINFDNNFQKKLNQISELTGATKLYGKEVEKVTKAYGSHLKVPTGDFKQLDPKLEKYIKNLGVTPDNLSGRLFDLHSKLMKQTQNPLAQGSLFRLQGGLTDLTTPAGSNKELVDQQKQTFKELMDWSAKFKISENENIFERMQNFGDMYSFFNDVNNTFMGLIASRRDYEHEKQMRLYDAEMEKITERYNLEVEAAGDSILQRSIAENAYQEEKKKIEKKANDAKKEQAQKQWRADMMQIALNGPVMATSFIASLAKIGPAAIPIGLSLAGGVIAAQLAVAAANNPADAFFSGGKVEGRGNSTSDSVPANLSKGEWVFSRDDVERLGGDSTMQRLITMGNNFSSSPINVNIGTVLGEENYLRQKVVPFIKEELKR